MESTSDCVGFGNHDFPNVLIVLTILFPIDLQLGTSKWIIRVVPIPLSNSAYISTTFICWSDVACDSSKLLNCGQLSLIFDRFSTMNYFSDSVKGHDCNWTFGKASQTKAKTCQRNKVLDMKTPFQVMITCAAIGGKIQVIQMQKNYIFLFGKYYQWKKRIKLKIKHPD